MNQFSKLFNTWPALLIYTLSLFLPTFSFCTNMDLEYNLAKQFGENAKKTVETASQSQTGIAQVPGYDSSAANRKAEELKHANLSHQSMLEKENNAAAQSVEVSEKERIQYKHIEKEPLVTGSQAIADNPEKMLSQTYKDCHEVVIEDRRSEKEELKSCEESGAPEEHDCYENLIVTKIAAEPLYQKFRVSFETTKSGSLYVLTKPFWFLKKDRHREIDQSACIAEFNKYWNGIDAATGQQVDFIPGSVRSVTFVRFHGPTIIFKGKHKHLHWYTQFSEYEIEAAVPQFTTEEKWQSNCNPLEKMSDDGLCSYQAKVCSQGPETRNIAGLSVYKDCWQYKYTYMCEYPSKNDCEELRNRGCEQQSAICKTWFSGRCVDFAKTFLCRSYTLKEGAPFKTKLMCGDTPYCMTADCINSSYDPNDEMGQAISQLSIFNQMQKKFTADNLKIFEGEKAWCHKDMLGFCDCCGHGKGWGMSLNMAKCSGDEKLLSEKRKRNLCRQIGTYCAHKSPLGFCEKKRTTFCCFGSQLIRSIQEQGRAQIGKRWGTAKDPNCDSFTIDEFVKIDFSKLDLSEFFQEVMASCQKLDLTRMAGKVQERVEQMQSSIQRSDVRGQK